MKKKYYKYLDIIRVLSCIAVFLYHLNILKGGYLAVCTFFVLTGYLSCISNIKKKDFSILNYYKNRLLHIYLPFLIVVFLSIFVIHFIPSINWFNLKPETTSVIFGYNNYWQINANMDYFARHISSPFMHFWYIATLLQFELIFPFLFLLFKKIGDKHKKISITLLSIITIISCGYFFFIAITSKNITNVYYNSLTRVFSIFFGMCLGFISSYYKSFIPFKNKNIKKMTFYMYVVLLVILFIFIDSKSVFFSIAMILVTIISGRLVDYATDNNEKSNRFDNFIKYISNISYEVYLVQYPVIFIFQYIYLKDYIEIPVIILITFIISIILHIALDFKDKKKYKYLLLTIVSLISLCGAYLYITEKDHTDEINALKSQLENNEKVMKERQIKYADSLKQDKDNWDKVLSDLENSESNLASMVTNLPIIGVGDSVMLGAVTSLNSTFPNGYFDAMTSRTDYEANRILVNLNNRGMLGETVLIHLGTNGQCGDSCRNNIMETVGDRKIFWVTVTNDNDVHVNNGLVEYSNKFDNSYIIDWNSISSGHNEYFIADKIHLTSIGMDAYAKAIYDSIYNVYKEEFDKKKEEVLKEHDSLLKEKVTFYGNELLLNASSYLQKDFTDAEFVIDKEFTYNKLINKLKSNSSNYNVVFIFDNSININKEQYMEIIKLCKDKKVYILNLSSSSLNIDGSTTIDFYKEINKHSDYVMSDNIHLTNKGNSALSKLLVKQIKH